MSDDTIFAPPPIEPIKLKDALEERYLAYALSTITQRALPDVRDGLSRRTAACFTRCGSSSSTPRAASRSARASSATDRQVSPAWRPVRL